MKTREEAEREQFAALLDQYAPGADRAGQTQPGIGDTVSGRILEIGADAVFVDLGGKAEGVIERIELTDSEGELTVAVGDTVEAQVAGQDPETGAIRLRKRIGHGTEVAAAVREAHALGLPVEGRVSKVVKGGLEVEVGALRAFCPASQADLRYVENLEELVGRRLEFRITRLEEGRGRPNLVLSRRVLLEEEAKAREAEAREKVKVGSVLPGTVTSLAPYGAFVDLGGVEGMLHVSEIAHARIAHPEEVLAVGQQLEVQVLRIEPGKDGRDRIALSRKSLEASPWQGAAARFPAGTEVPGRVMRLESFGAFVEIAPGLEGLLHVSELGRDRRIQHAREAVQLGQDLRVRVKSVEPERRRISLILAPSAAEAPAEEIERYRAGEASAGGGFGALGDFLRKAKTD
ncbi:MAG: S1 RNA-binding domain-containing protein [Acidobacteria bacterium]|nr:S1 RNA-binding domain-containing protein [Acidobacteriota bacterium]MCB9378651.1 S1 RNA-binding domain-containing protein [Holophagales bacterium]